HIVSNFWNLNIHTDFYQSIVDAWVAAGILSVFPAGDNGPFCNTVGSPGDYANAYAVGAFDSNDVIAPFSARGSATPDGGLVKPNIAAPGVDIRSSVPGGEYGLSSGTGTAASHVAGTVALMWSAAPALVGDIDGTHALLDRTAVDVADGGCEDYAAPLSAANITNPAWGEGRLDAFEAVAASPRGTTGTLAGTITDAVTSDPLGGATIEITGTFTRTLVATAAATYTTVLPVGVFNLTARAFGYEPASAVGITVSANLTQTQDFALTPLPRHAISGQVHDTSGAPIFGARVTLDDTPIVPAITDANGAFGFPAVPEGTYSGQADAGGCNATQTFTVTVDADETIDLTLPQRTDSYGYFCRTEPASYIDATNVVSLTGDVASAGIEMPFPFTLYGQTYSTTLYVSTDGSLNFHGPTDFFGPLDNAEIPNAFEPNAAIYPFWDDLIVDEAASVRTEVIGSAPNRGLVIEWRNVAFYLEPDKRVNFEAVLYENGDILTQYANNAADDLLQGGSATAGIENESGTVALQYSYNAPLLANSLAIRYQLPPSGFVEGTVSDANDGLPVVNATVQALHDGAPLRVAATDAQGRYRMQLPLGTYTVEATSANYSVETAQVT
ncbi:MAG TPA: carboxypeptidase regulatory-like domain-containing protein, partial [Roseiflexaceae bacterium]|nr:carboxypeptidase regulatory-like domain-containing protein [Roseiflexaceae bacterium]